jgi:hypothetical protein
MNSAAITKSCSSSKFEQFGTLSNITPNGTPSDVRVKSAVSGVSYGRLEHSQILFEFDVRENSLLLEHNTVSLWRRGMFDRAPNVACPSFGGLNAPKNSVHAADLLGGLTNSAARPLQAAPCIAAQGCGQNHSMSRWDNSIEHACIAAAVFFSQRLRHVAWRRPACPSAGSRLPAGVSRSSAGTPFTPSLTAGPGKTASPIAAARK